MTASYRGRGVAAAAVLIGVLAACPGDNLFTTGVSDATDPPQITQLVVPDSVTPGGLLPIQTRAVASVNLAFVGIALRRAVVTDSTFFITPARPDALIVAEFFMPSVLADSEVLVRVVAQDVRGARSPTVEASVRVVQNQP